MERRGLTKADAFCESSSFLSPPAVRCVLFKDNSIASMQHQRELFTLLLRRQCILGLCRGGDHMDPKVLFVLVAAAAVGVGTIIKKRKS